MELPQSFTLSTGTSMPVIGLGTSFSAPGDVEAAVEIALATGYTLIDGAPVYGNEREIGTALTKCFEEGILESREDLFYVSKLANEEHRPERVGPHMDRTLRHLQLDYVDLYLMHWPIAIDKHGHKTARDHHVVLEPDVSIRDTWHAMEELVDAGKAKAIGVSNFTIADLKDLLSYARIKPVVNQIESHPYLPQPDMIKFCKKHGIVVMAYAPLGSPGLRETSQFEKLFEGIPPVLECPEVLAVAEKYDCSPTTICLSWQVQRGVTVIPKSVTESRIKENLELIELDEEDIETIDGIKERVRYITGEHMGCHMFGDELRYGADAAAKAAAHW